MQGQTTEDENFSPCAEVERLREREAASREILGVISQNRSDERPVLDAITQNAVKLAKPNSAPSPASSTSDLERPCNTRHQQRNLKHVLQRSVETTR